MNTTTIASTLKDLLIEKAGASTLLIDAKTALTMAEAKIQASEEYKGFGSNETTRNAHMTLMLSDKIEVVRSLEKSVMLYDARIKAETFMFNALIAETTGKTIAE
jgi:hypothetical protein